MTRLDQYNDDMARVFSAVVVVGSIAICTLIMLITHFIFGGAR
jgi:hypothetical protein